MDNQLEKDSTVLPAAVSPLLQIGIVYPKLLIKVDRFKGYKQSKKDNSQTVHYYYSTCIPKITGGQHNLHYVQIWMLIVSCVRVYIDSLYNCIYNCISWGLPNWNMLACCDYWMQVLWCEPINCFLCKSIYRCVAFLAVLVFVSRDLKFVVFFVLESIQTLQVINKIIWWTESRIVMAKMQEWTP